MKKISLVIFCMIFSATAYSQNWPQKSVRLVVPFPAGGATDIPARILSEKLSTIWGQTLLVENKVGAGGSIAAVEVAKSPADGYTLFFPAGAVLTANEYIYSNLKYNPDRDFVPITTVSSAPLVLSVPINSKFKTVEDLLRAARENPGSLSFGNAGIGSQSHIASENFLYMSGISANSIPYKGDPPALVDLVGGGLDFCICAITPSLPLIKGGKLRALGVASLEPVNQLPGVRTIASTVPGYEAKGWFGIVGVKGTPNAVVQKIYKDVNLVLNDSAVKERFAAAGMEVIADTPEQMKIKIEAERARLKVLIKERKIYIE